MFIRRAPGWAGWSTVLLGLGSSFLVQRFPDREVRWRYVRLTSQWRREASDWAQAAGILINIVVGSGWFLLTPVLARNRPEEEVQRVDAFFTEMHVPIDFEKEEKSAGSDNVQEAIDGHALSDLRSVHHRAGGHSQRVDSAGCRLSSAG